MKPGFNFIFHLILAFSLCSTVLAESPHTERIQALKLLQQQAKSTIDNPTPENPFYMKAGIQDSVSSGEAAVYLDMRLEQIVNSLSTLRNWCDILPLHINVKTCLYNAKGDEMTLYMGRKFYQTPEDAFELNYHFKTIQSDDYFAAIAMADSGPLKTTDYQIRLEFIPDGDGIFGRIFVSNQQSWLSKKGMEIYLSTLGKDKTGIKVVDHDKNGTAIYSSGEDGVAERNLVRYFFAFKTFFEHATEDDTPERYDAQLKQWFNLTKNFPQLHEMSEQEYLYDKRMERKNQLTLQVARTPG